MKNIDIGTRRRNGCKKILLLLSLTCLLTACNKHHSKYNKDTLNIEIGNEPDTLDPQYVNDRAANRVTDDLFEGLMDFNQKNQVVAGLAKSFEISKNGLTYTFHLRHHLRFSNGTPLTAHDFVYSWQRLVNPKNAAVNSYVLENVVNARQILSGQLTPDKLGVEAADNNTFIVHLVNPDLSFINYCAGITLSVLPESIILRYGKSWTHPRHIATSGAYMLKQHIVNGYILVQKNPWYWDSDNVKIENVKYVPFVDINTALDAYKAGEIDITKIPIDSTKDLALKYKKELHVIQEEGVYTLDLNMHLPLFANNLKLRQALSMAIDRETLTHDILSQEQNPLYSFVTPSIDNHKYADAGYSWRELSHMDRILEARKLFKEAGYGLQNPLHLTLNFNTNDLNRKVMLSIASMWQKNLGVDVILKNEGWNVFLNDRRNGNFMISRDTWQPEYPLVSAYLMIYTCDSPENYSKYCNKDYDSLVRVARYNQNENEKEILYDNAIRLLENDYAVIPIFQYTYAKLVKPYVKNYHIDTNSLDRVQSKWFYLNE